MADKHLQSSQKWLGTILMISSLVTGCGTETPQATAPQALPVQLQTLQTATLVNSSAFVGYLEARQRVDLAPSRTNGRIVSILVGEGDTVRQGQRLIEIEPQQQKEQLAAATGSLNVARADLRAAEAEFRQREAERDQARANVENARATLAGTEADVQRVEAELILAEKNFGRAKFLESEDVVTKESLDEATRTLNATQSQLKSQKKTRDASAQALKAAQQNFVAAERRVDQSFANVDSRQSAITQAQGQQGSTAVTLDYNFLTSPINGVVGAFNTHKIGDNVNVGETITTVTDNQVFFLNVNIPTENRDRIKKGLPVEIIKTDGSPGVRGSITFIASLVEQNAQSILVKMTFPNDGSLRDRQYVRARVIWDTQPGVLVPTTAVTSLGGQKFVYVAQEGKSKDSLIAKQIPVKVGAIQGQSYQVISGVKPGDRIAVSRILDLKDGRPIISQDVTTN
ncbi:efflux RND transporter periplasmic adaptor subunit [Crocosphaera sp. XPORK-15E]|uniref:efflux RND transporter periplasmic adaptor subunit n=1 Tax=Crocosphaera sp. XPORK-15E TaxID=3110247 RepID=UPI002B1E9073|nr:efflux RND transporter periplasmic adaptor subunit [Crocosphaera sp. XPORK-15E]MEA5536146.1 efflux RND transporter periplasmic adaptor subunit [Crocosphaera sp. XPORK-15E]